MRFLKYSPDLIACVLMVISQHDRAFDHLHLLPEFLFERIGLGQPADPQDPSLPEYI